MKQQAPVKNHEATGNERHQGSNSKRQQTGTNYRPSHMYSRGKQTSTKPSQPQYQGLLLQLQIQLNCYLLAYSNYTSHEAEMRGEGGHKEGGREVDKKKKVGTKSGDNKEIELHTHLST
jgi:hypothetical protein